MSVIYLKIGNTDYSSHITSYKDYRVEEQNVSYQWTDGFGGLHTNVYNTLIKGSMALFFAGANGQEFLDFQTALASATTDGITAMKLWISNKGVNKDVNVTYSINSNKFAELNGVYGNIITLNVEEAAVYE